MKRWLIVSFVLYVVVALVIIIFDRKTLDEIVILAFPRHWTQYWDDETETISFTLFFSSTDTFLCDESQMEGAMLSNEDVSIALTLTEMKRNRTNIVFENSSYTSIEFLFVPDVVSTSGLQIDLRHAILELAYQNGEMISIKVGDIGMVFPSDQTDCPISLTRLYGIFAEDTGQMTGFVLGLSAESNLLVTLTSFSVGPTTAILETDNIMVIDQDYRSVEELELYAVSNGHVAAVSWDFEDEVLLYVPILTPETTMSLHRFPIFVTCLAFNVEYRLDIDDFLFRSLSAYEPEYDLYAEKTIYRY